MAIDRLKLLMDNNEETVELLDTCSLISFPNHPFHLYTGERREGLKKEHTRKRCNDANNSCSKWKR